MKKLGIALLAISMCFACGDAEEDRTMEPLEEGQYENLEDAYTRDNATLDALDRCDVAAATVYNDDELLACESAFETCSNVEIGLLTNKLECEAGLTDNCDEDALQLSPECAEGYASIAPPNNGAWTDFQAWASGTNWCGAGTDLAGTPCPVSGGDGGDMACHRHDHGKKADGIIGGMAVKLGCDIDHGLAARTSNGAAQAVFGSWGLGQTWGCYDHGSYSCWNWVSKWYGGYWRYGSYCSGEHGHYGPWRYSNYSHSYGWNSQSRCSTDLSWSSI